MVFLKKYIKIKNILKEFLILFFVLTNTLKLLKSINKTIK